MSSTIHLDKLPIELIHKILNYLSSNDIFISFYNINPSMNMILNTYDRYELIFQSINMSKFDLISHLVNPCQIISLTLSNMDDTPGQFQLFLSLFSIKQFIKLRTLQLIQPSNPIDFNQILTDLHTIKSLKSLSILHCQPSSVNQQTFILFSSLLSTSSSLRRLYLSGALNTIFEYDLTSSIDHLYFNDNLCNTVPLQIIISRMPYLKSLDTAITLNMNYNNLSSFNNLTRLTLTIFINMNDSDLKILLKHMPLLVYFKLIANGKQWFNGYYWEECLPLNLKIFQFNFSTQSIHINEQVIFETFQTSFWIDKKHWNVMLDYQMNPTMTHLYSLPYCDTQFYYRPSIDPTHQLRSLVPIDKSYMNNVTKLTLDLSAVMNEVKMMSSTHLFSNISTLVLSDSKCCLSVEPLFEFLKSIIDLNHITELKLGQFHHPDLLKNLCNHLPRLHSLQIVETMFNELEMLDFRNITHLNIFDSLHNVEKMCSIFPSIEHLNVRLITFEQMQQVFELLEKTLINVTFRHINQELQEHVIKWLEEDYSGHRQFSYDTDEHMNLHIWLCDYTI